MAFMKFCDKCKTKYPYGEECPNKCKGKAKKEADSYYTTYQRTHNSFYESRAWRKLRLVVINRFDGLCLWSYIKHKRIERGIVVHHIVEVKDDISKSLDINNLMPLTDEAHREIHQLYKTNKKGTQVELLKMINLWNNRES